MKKLTLYLIIFISLFVGTATCVVVNGYHNYTKEQLNQSKTEVTAENTALTQLASNVLNTEFYSGSIEFSDSTKSTLVSGTFSYINSNELQAEIHLTGKFNNIPITASVALIDEYVYIDYNNTKIKLKTSDFLKSVNDVISVINTSTNSELAEIDTSALTSLISNITTTTYGSGYIINANIPNLCDIYIKTDSNYIPEQILASNIVFGNNTYSLNIIAKQQKSEINIENDSYLDATPALNYAAPLINTLNQGNLSISGTLNISGTEAKLRAYIPKEKNTIIGYIEFLGFKINYQIENNFVIIDLYGNIYKTTTSNLVNLIQDILPNKTGTTSLTNIISSTNISATIENNLITNCFIDMSGTTIDISIGKTLIMPAQIDDSSARDLNELKSLIENLLPLVSSTYSADVAINTENININGKLYAEIDFKSTAINTLAFEGKINNLNTIVVYTSTATYINVDNNKIRLSNTALCQIITTLSELTGGDISSVAEKIKIDSALLKNISLDHKSIELKLNDNSLKLTINPATVTLDLNTTNLNASFIITPNSTAYKYINKLVNDEEFKSFDNTPTLINALKNTLKQDNISFSGSINIDILGLTYKNIGVDILSNQSGNTQIVLSNLPTDSIITYLSNINFKDQTSTITIDNNFVTIYTTVTHRVTNKVTCIFNKTIPIQEFSLDNLYEIMSMRKSIIEKLKSGNTTEFSSNLSTDCVDILNSSTRIDLSRLAPNLFNELLAEFNYSTRIDSATLIINIQDKLNIKLQLFAK